MAGRYKAGEVRKLPESGGLGSGEKLLPVGAKRVELKIADEVSIGVDTKKTPPQETDVTEN